MTAKLDNEARPHPMVVVGVDGSVDGELAAQWASAYVKQAGGCLEVVCTHSGRVVHGLPPVAVSYDTSRGAEIAIDKAVADMTLSPDQIIRSPVQGSARHVLTERSRHADLLVVGSRGLGATGRALLGSVSTHLVHHAHCPVVVVPREQTEH